MLLRNASSALTIAPILARRIGPAPRLQGTNVPVAHVNPANSALGSSSLPPPLQAGNHFGMIHNTSGLQVSHAFFNRP